MTLPPERVVVETEGLTLSQIIWRRFRRPRFGLLEEVLALNPGLGSQPAHLPVGTSFLLPIDPPAVGSNPVVITLWD